MTRGKQTEQNRAKPLKSERKKRLLPLPLPLPLPLLKHTKRNQLTSAKFAKRNSRRGRNSSSMSIGKDMLCSKPYLPEEEAVGKGGRREKENDDFIKSNSRRNQERKKKAKRRVRMLGFLQHGIFGRKLAFVAISGSREVRWREGKPAYNRGGFWHYVF